VHNWPVRRFRTKSASLGALLILVNIGIVVAIVTLVGSRTGGVGLPPFVSSSADGTSSPSAGTSSGTPKPPPAAITTLVEADRPVTFAVLGDGTGDEDGEWVSRFGRLLGDTRRVVLHNLDQSDPTRYADQVVYGTSGPETVIWNGSRRGAEADYAAERLDFLVPQKPDVVVLNYGRDDHASQIASALTTTLKAVRAKWPGVPVVTTLQPPDRDDVIGPVRVATEEWSEQHQLPTIDVAQAFSEAGDPNSFVSVLDPPSVNAKGGRLWARTAYAAFGGDVTSGGTSTSTETSS